MSKNFSFSDWVLGIIGAIIATVIGGLILDKIQNPQVFSNKTTLTSSSFYFIQDSAHANVGDAQNKVKNLKASGYNNANYLWIPDFPNLSGKFFYSVYPASFSNRRDCANFLQQYSLRNPTSYCVYASKNPADPPDRLYAK
ncbi:MAG: hypothetical protein J7647_08650 [Cyanobacteria bacterium SBLK]|nr:hypothetical protein [Cyanobacteria bacterium SBLK]